MKDLADVFGVPTEPPSAEPRYNVAPTESVQTLRSDARVRRFVPVRWGLIPSWSRGPDGLPLIINARSETLTAKPAFRDLVAEFRCAVLADGFFEWRTELGARQPYYIRRRDGVPMAFAALWDAWGSTESCAIVTTEANQLLLPLHDRMPVVLAKGDLDQWLDPGERDFERLREALRPGAPGLLEAYPVSTRVNRVGGDDSDLLEPLARAIQSPEDWQYRPAAGSAAPSDQLGLFSDD